MRDISLLLGHARNKLPDNRMDQHRIVEEVLTLWSKCDENVQPFDFAHALLNAAESIMLIDDDLDNALAFGEFTKEAGTITIRAIRTHWPPLD